VQVGVDQAADRIAGQAGGEPGGQRDPLARNGSPSERWRAANVAASWRAAVHSNPVTTDGTPTPSMPLPPQAAAPRNHRSHVREPQAAPNFIPGIAPRSGATLSHLVTRLLVLLGGGSVGQAIRWLREPHPDFALGG